MISYRKEKHELQIINNINIYVETKNHFILNQMMKLIFDMFNILNKQIFMDYKSEKRNRIIMFLTYTECKTQKVKNEEMNITEKEYK